MINDEELDRVLEERNAEVDESDEDIEELDETDVDDEEQLQTTEQDEKSITEVKVADVKVTLNKNKSVQEQLKDVIDYAATSKALEKEDVVSDLVDAKAEELVESAKTKSKDAKKQSTNADVGLQKATREKFSILFDTFGVTSHIPMWLCYTLMGIFVPFYVAFVVLIGIPTGFVRFLIECIDGILVRYDKSEDKRKPKIRITVWIILALLVLAAICLTTLACLHII